MISSCIHFITPKKITPKNLIMQAIQWKLCNQVLEPRASPLSHESAYPVSDSNEYVTGEEKKKKKNRKGSGMGLCMPDIPP